MSVIRLGSPKFLDNLPWQDLSRFGLILKCLALKGLQVEGSIQKLPQRHQVSVLVSSGWCSCWFPTNIPGGGETAEGRTRTSCTHDLELQGQPHEEDGLSGQSSLYTVNPQQTQLSRPRTGRR